MQKSIIIVLCACLFIGCRTNAVHDNRNGADAVREHIGELAAQQTELAITGTELESRIERSAQAVGELERTITDGAANLERFKTILQRIRERGGTDTSRTAGDN